MERNIPYPLSIVAFPLPNPRLEIELAGTKQTSFGSDTLNCLVLLGKLMLLDELIGDTPPDCFKTSQGVTSVTYRGKTYIWDYTGGKIIEKEI